MKVIEIKYPNGDTYTLDLMIVAKNKADYYYENDEAEHKEEIECIMNDRYDGIDWLKNNMLYKDIKDHLILKSKGEPDFDDFCNFDMKIKG